MSDLIRDAPIGQVVRWITRNRVLQYPEERQNFEIPVAYKDHNGSQTDSQQTAASAEHPLPDVETVLGSAPRSGSQSQPDSQRTVDIEKESDRNGDYDLEKIKTAKDLEMEGQGQNDMEKVKTAKDEQDLEHMQPAKSTKTNRTAKSSKSARTLDRVPTQTALAQAHTRQDLEQQLSNASMSKQPTQPIVPGKLDDGTILVDWYDTDDPANPQNWSLKKKLFSLLLLCLYTLGVYMGSAIYTPSIQGVSTRFGVSITAAELGLALYVLAYGIGPMVWSPISEIPVIGRNPPYIITFAIFVILCVPTALVDNFAGLLVLRFLQGFFGSPCLATGGASMGDMFSLIKLPYAICLWALAATCGPALGPMISGFSVAAENWRWSLWEMLWLSGPVWVAFLFLPETSGPNILLWRARRLRKLTGDSRLKSQSEIDQANLNPREVAIEALWRPILLMLLDPAIAFTAVYVALLYGIYYSFFEAFPLVYVDIYGFNLGQMGLTFLSITVAVVISIAVYWSYIYWVVEPEIRANGLGAPERRLIPALFAAWLCPVGLFIYAWTSRASVHWIVSVIGVGIFTVGVFILIQCIFLYLPFVYPQYAASLFAGNDLARSTLAAGAVLFSRPLYTNLGIGSGVSMLAAFTTACIAGVYILFYFGDRLRARSRYAAK
ncbi:benomyl/methotrexate resistance protein [Viridothelium virens]|uniref:Benomyl/methotrexate resistance protein n=1 Tax=Viridothelium virens TaxID=1048519 RepID=A0A6A6HMK4_VIRVR|nr:benomyl/methotrexate resistance protein [Viridothelium virens]